jgi:hypothetical protein
MACEICGRSSCTRCFHSIEEQDEFDNKIKSSESTNYPLTKNNKNGEKEPE